MVRHNEPGAPTNTPQHTPTQERQPPGGDAGDAGPKHRQTGTGTAPPDRDVADPHAIDENHERSRQREPRKGERPSGARH